MIVDWVLLGLRVFTPLLLYTFLGLVFYRILVTPGKTKSPPARLRHLDDPETIFPLQADVSLGRAPDNTAVLDSDVVSTYHARLTYREGSWWLTDLGSTNGTFLNDIPVQTPTPLVYGDIVSLGNIHFRLERTDPDEIDR